jgi:hypothetical protein
MGLPVTSAVCLIANSFWLKFELIEVIENCVSADVLFIVHSGRLRHTVIKEIVVAISYDNINRGRLQERP